MWIVTDKWGNEIRLTDERWKHIIEHHWELEGYLDEILETVRIGRRKQFADVPSKYKYSKSFENLPHNYTHIVVVVKLELENFLLFSSVFLLIKLFFLKEKFGYCLSYSPRKEKMMIHNNNNLKIFYDEEADVLYITSGNPEYTDYVEYTDDVILRFEPGTKKLVGFTIIDFSLHFAKKEPDIHLPFGVNFQFTEEQIWATTPE